MPLWPRALPASGFNREVPRQKLSCISRCVQLLDGSCFDSEWPDLAWCKHFGRKARQLSWRSCLWPANLMSSPMPYPLGHRASWLTPARQVAAGYLQQGKLASNTRRFHLSPSLGEWSSNQSCCHYPCFPDGGIWPGGVTVSAPDSESGNRGSNPRRAFAETRFVKGGKVFRVCCCLWQKVRAARQAVSSPPSSVGRAQGP